MSTWRTLPNLLTLARVAAIPFLAVLLLARRYDMALPVLFLTGISDALDGYLARRLNQASRLGQVLDPAADKLLLFTVYLTLAWTGALPWWITGLVIGRDVVIVLGALLLFTARQRREFAPTLWGKISTFYQLLLAGCTVLQGALPVGWVPGLFLEFLLAGATAATLWSGIDYVRIGAGWARSASAR